MDSEAWLVTGEAGYSEPGFAERYDQYRPPAALLELVAAAGRSTPAHLVVDFGSGTGLSKRCWHCRRTTGSCIGSAECGPAASRRP